MPAAPLPADEAERLAALRGYAILDTPPEENFDRIVRLACRLFSVPIALISLVDENRQWFKARQGLEATETPRDVAFCAHAILEDGVLVVPDATQDQRFADNPLVQGGPGIRFYAGAPLISPTGQRIGTLCLIDTISRTDFSTADRASLRDLGGVVMDEMEMRRTREMIRENEDRYRRLYNKTPAMMYSIDEEGRMLAVSDYWLQHLGYGREEVLGRKSVDFLTPESRDRAVREALPRFFEMGEVRDVPLQFVTRDGGVLDTELSAVAERDQEGRFLNSLTLVRDVTQQKAIEAQFRQAQKMEAVGQLTGGVAHDFNNLLAVILGNLQLLQASGQLEGKAEKRAQATLEATERGAELTRRLLAYARKSRLETTVVEADSLVRNTESLLARTLGESVTLTLDLAAGGSHISIDTSQLETAILNLAINGRDAMGGGGTLRIRTARQRVGGRQGGLAGAPPAGDYVVISVKDSGPGIDPEILDKVFDPFFTTKEAGEGTGLGLSMVYGFIRQSGGHVQIQSVGGEGATVLMYLPAAKAPAEETARPLTDDASPRGNETVLVVEDSPSVREMAIALLESLGYATVPAPNGAVAISILHERPDVEILFTDIVMPGGMNGTNLAAAALAIRPDLAVLYTSGFAEHSLTPDSRPNDDWPLIGKPYRKAELARRLRQALALGKQRQPTETI